MYEKISRIYLDRLFKKNKDIAKELNIVPSLYKIQEYRRNWMQNVNRMSRNRVQRILRKLQTNRQKKPEEPVKETSRRVEMERFNKCPDSMLAT
jgi:hypothetical protein